MSLCVCGVWGGARGGAQLAFRRGQRRRGLKGFHAPRLAALAAFARCACQSGVSSFVGECSRVAGRHRRRPGTQTLNTRTSRPRCRNPASLPGSKSACSAAGKLGSCRTTPRSASRNWRPWWTCSSRSYPNCPSAAPSWPHATTWRRLHGSTAAMRGPGAARCAPPPCMRLDTRAGGLHAARRCAFRRTARAIAIAALARRAAWARVWQKRPPAAARRARGGRRGREARAPTRSGGV